jgi:hypothetical protein
MTVSVYFDVAWKGPKVEVDSNGEVTNVHKGDERKLCPAVIFLRLPLFRHLDRAAALWKSSSKLQSASLVSAGGCYQTNRCALFAGRMKSFLNNPTLQLLPLHLPCTASTFCCSRCAKC